MLLDTLFKGKTVIGSTAALLIYILAKQGVVIPEGQAVSFVIVAIGLGHKLIKADIWPVKVKEFFKKLKLAK